MSCLVLVSTCLGFLFAVSLLSWIMASKLCFGKPLHPWRSWQISEVVWRERETTRLESCSAGWLAIRLQSISQSLVSKCPITAALHISPSPVAMVSKSPKSSAAYHRHTWKNSDSPQPVSNPANQTYVSFRVGPIFRISHNQHPQTKKSTHVFCSYSYASMAIYFFQHRFPVFHPPTISDDGWKLTWRHFSIGSVQSWEFYYIEDKGLGRKRETVKGKLGCWGWNWSTPTHTYWLIQSIIWNQHPHTLIQSIAFIWTQH